MKPQETINYEDLSMRERMQLMPRDEYQKWLDNEIRKSTRAVRMTERFMKVAFVSALIGLIIVITYLKTN